MHARRERLRRGLRSLYVWHRWLGVASAFVVLMLAVTGILLNHGHGLHLDRNYVATGWLLDWYGIQASQPSRAYRIDGHWLSENDGTIFLDTRPVAALGGQLLTGLESDGLVVAVSRDAVLLISPAGELVERIGEDALPGAILSAGTQHGGIVLNTTKGQFRSSADLLRWEAYSGPAIPAATSQALPTKVAQAVSQAVRERTLTWERVIGDLHSGRLFGRLGPLTMDLAAGGFIVLALSGLLLWLRHLRSQQQRRLRGH